MKLAIIFEVPDGQAAGVAARMVQHHKFSEQQGIKHWSFDQEMRPVAGVLIPDGIAQAAQMARREVDQEHPWVPGAAFARHPGMKPALLAFLDALLLES